MSEMRLSEAIRLGSMLKPQAKRVTRSHDGGTCALGAALDAIGVTDGIGWFPIYEHFPIASVKVDYPGTNWKLDNTRVMSVGSACWILNDCDGWPREAIADWVETIERAQDTRVGCADQLAMEPELESRALAQKCI